MTETSGTPYFQADFPIAEFAGRRKQVAQAIGRSASAVLRGGIATGAFDIFRQTNEFYYLSGVEVPHSCLCIEGESGFTTLYLPHGDAHAAASEGKELNADEPELAATTTGVDSVKQLSALVDDLAGIRNIYVPLSPGESRMQCRDTLRQARKQRHADPWEDPKSAEEKFLDRLAAVNRKAWYHDLSPILDCLRLIKSPREIDLMRRAGALTARSVLEAMRATRIGMTEYELGAIADFVYLLNGAKGGGYRPIIPGGPNIWNGHYYRNNQPLRDGDLVLMDYAPDVGCYTSDIGRMWPVNGKYSSQQRELYGYIVEYHKVLLALIGPGRTPEEIRKEAAEKMMSVVDSWRWSKPCYEAAARRTLEFKGHLSHPVGMAVHDVGRYYDSPLKPGTVFALDPQMWIPEEKLYIRVEDTVAITATGVENLTTGVPFELDETEREIGIAPIEERYRVQ